MVCDSSGSLVNINLKGMSTANSVSGVDPISSSEIDTAASRFPLLIFD